METIKLINFIIATVFFVCYSYQFAYILVPYLKKEKPHKPAELHRYAVLISARNEELVIGNLLDSISAQDYPSSLVRVFVVADNCTDKTAKVARAHGAIVYERFTDSNLNHTGIYLYSKGKIMIHLTFDYKTDEKCTTPGQYLKYHRTFQGLSTRELAEKVGIVPATLVLYENDRHPIKYKTAVALANALGIDRNRLLDEYTAFVDYPYSSLLKKVRQDLSLTQIQMAELIGIGQTSYSGWEREIRVPRRKEYDTILAALEKLRVNVDTYLCQSASI